MSIFDMFRKKPDILDVLSGMRANEDAERSEAIADYFRLLQDRGGIQYTSAFLNVRALGLAQTPPWRIRDWYGSAQKAIEQGKRGDALREHMLAIESRGAPLVAVAAGGAVPSTAVPSTAVPEVKVPEVKCPGCGAAVPYTRARCHKCKASMVFGVRTTTTTSNPSS